MEADFLLSEFDTEHLGLVIWVCDVKIVPIFLNQYTQLNGIAPDFYRK